MVLRQRAGAESGLAAQSAALSGWTLPSVHEPATADELREAGRFQIDPLILG